MQQQINQLLEKMQKVQVSLLEYIDDNEMNFNDFIELLEKLQIQSDIHEFTLFNYFLSKISGYHYRFPNFFNKIFQILQYFKDNYKKYYSNHKIFEIFKSNKRIILFLIEEKILSFDDIIISEISGKEYQKLHYLEYFQPEINELSKNESISNSIPEDFEENRKIGENENYICKLIRNDSIDDFIVYTNKTNFPIHSTKIKQSIYETNLLLIDKTPTLIEYAAFFGSIQIFNYLRFNKAELNDSLWFYSIHGQNPDIIHFLEDNKIEKNDKDCIIEAIKCHCNDLVDYFNNIAVFDIKEQNQIEKSFHLQSMESYNFKYMQSDLIDISLFEAICKFDYYCIAEIILKSTDVNTKISFNKITF